VIYTVSSPYMFVSGDDRVIWYIEADDVVSGAMVAQSRRGASLGKLLWSFYIFL